MTFHKEGIVSLIIAIVFGAILVSIGRWIGNPILFYLLAAFALFILIVIVQFFRSPSRNWNKNDKAIIAPADGKVVVIEEVEETEFLKKKVRQISIFMSPINVHVNRYPIAGEVVYAKYHPGKFLVAWHPKSSTENERTSVAVLNDNGKTILFRQIAGALARRIVMYAKEGDTAKQTDQFGFIKFGSRVDIFIPLDAKVNVKMDEVVKGGITEIASW
jgi:phosphatidylserine decarboxylase